ncbi:MAG: hypothetical protein IPK76_20045 [Lewinellaceae bacterium]|jgi:hypothetical protein|nr:hypothetical protein [Lewinellaceae bacterium]
MNIKHLLLVASLSTLFLGQNACKDGGTSSEDTNAPVLTITSPAADEAFLGEVHIELNVTDESLHEMSVKVTKDADGSVVFEDAPEVHDETDFDFHHHFTPAGISGVTAMTLTVTVEDHSANITTKTVKFTAQ